MTIEVLLNDFAVRSFRDVADADYIVARMACRSRLTTQYLWASQQAVEKYLKCILLLNRIAARKVKHDLAAALDKINASGKLMLDLSESTKKFVSYLDIYGRFRYLEISHHAFGRDIVRLDRAAWEFRRYCTLSDIPRNMNLRQGVVPPKIRLTGGYLEKVMDDKKHPAREPLLWQNAFFGRRTRRLVRVPGGFHVTNSPLSLHPEILDELVKYVYLPKDIDEGYRALSQTKSP